MARRRVGQPARAALLRLGKAPLRETQKVIVKPLGARGVVSPSGELLKGLLAVVASSGRRGAEVGREGDGRAGHQGLGGGPDGGGADATGGDTEEGGRHDDRRVRNRGGEKMRRGEEELEV